MRKQKHEKRKITLTWAALAALSSANAAEALALAFSNASAAYNSYKMSVSFFYHRAHLNEHQSSII